MTTGNDMTTERKAKGTEGKDEPTERTRSEKEIIKKGPYRRSLLVPSLPYAALSVSHSVASVSHSIRAAGGSEAARERYA